MAVVVVVVVVVVAVCETGQVSSRMRGKSNINEVYVRIKRCTSDYPHIILQKFLKFKKKWVNYTYICVHTTHTHAHAHAHAHTHTRTHAHTHTHTHTHTHLLHVYIHSIIYCMSGKETLLNSCSTLVGNN